MGFLGTFLTTTTTRFGFGRAETFVAFAFGLDVPFEGRGDIAGDLDGKRVSLAKDGRRWEVTREEVLRISDCREKNMKLPKRNEVQVNL